MDERLTRVLVEVLRLPRERIADDLTMDGVENWDSLKHMELVAGIEQAFDLELSFEDIVAMQSIGAIRQVLQSRGAVS